MMPTDEAFEEELRLQFSMMEAPAPSPGLVEETVRKYRRWRMRRRLLVASPALAVAGAVGIVAGLGGFGGSGGRVPATNKPEIAAASMRLTRFTFPLPKGYQLASIDNACRALVIFSNPSPQLAPPGTGPYPYSPPRVSKLYPASSSPQTSTMAAAAATDGGCLLMALTVPFTPTQSTANPYLASSGQAINVNGYEAWLTASTGTSDGMGLVQLTVRLPAGNGKFEDLGIGARGLSAQSLLTIVSQGLGKS